MRTIIYVGYAVSEEECMIASGASVAGNKMQLNVLKELTSYPDINVIPITVYPCAAYPRDSKLIYSEKKKELWKNFTTIQIGFINLPIIKQLCQMINVYIQIEKQRKKYPDAEIFSFNMFPQVGNPLRWLKKKYKEKITINTLLADPPVLVENEEKKSTILQKMFIEQAKKNIEAVDGAIILNKYAAYDFLKQGQKYIVVDGGINISEETGVGKIDYKERKREIIFSGALEEYNGIKTLVNAMKLVESDVVLKIYGDGNLKNYVEKAAANNKKIRYMGKVSNEVMMKLQREAYLLLNPRSINEPISKVTFPSKMFEYLLSGTVVVSTKLNGFSEEYYDKMIWFEEDNAECIAKTIDRVIAMPEIELEKMANKAKKFVKEEKNWRVQVEKMYDFLKKTKNVK